MWSTPPGDGSDDATRRDALDMRPAYCPRTRSRPNIELRAPRMEGEPGLRKALTAHHTLGLPGTLGKFPSVQATPAGDLWPDLRPLDAWLDQHPVVPLRSNLRSPSDARRRLLRRSRCSESGLVKSDRAIVVTGTDERETLILLAQHHKPALAWTDRGTTNTRQYNSGTTLTCTPA